MATQYAITSQDPSGARAAKDRLESRDLAGKVRVSILKFTNPASGGVGIGEDIVWNTQLPNGARILPTMTKLFWSTGAASCTLTLGDSASTARYLAATAVTTAGSVAAEAIAASGATYVTGTNSGDKVLVSRCAGAAVAASQVITLYCYYVQD